MPRDYELTLTQTLHASGRVSDALAQRSMLAAAEAQALAEQAARCATRVVRTGWAGLLAARDRIGDSVMGDICTTRFQAAGSGSRFP